jgi:hypothetical protein
MFPYRTAAYAVLLAALVLHMHHRVAVHVVLAWSSSSCTTAFIATLLLQQQQRYYSKSDTGATAV